MQRIVVSLAMLFALVLIPAMGFAQNQNSQSLNQQTAQAIADKLSDKYPDYTINVRYNSGTATLSGELYSKDQVDEAVSYVQSLPGVSKVINTLKVAQQLTQVVPIQGVSRVGNNVVHSAVSETSAVQSVPQPAVVQQVPASNVITQVSGRQQMQGVVDFTQQIPPGATTQSPQVAAPPAPSVAAPPAPAPSLIQAPTSSVPTPTLTPAPTVQVGYLESSQQAEGTSYSAPFSNPAPITISTDQDVSYSPQYSPQYSSYSMNGNMPMPMGQQTATAGRYDQPNVPNYAWPAYAAPNNYSEVTYPRLYCPQAAPYIGPFYPYPQVPLEWRKVTLEWHDGYWWVDFDDGTAKGPFSPLFRQPNPKRY